MTLNLSLPQDPFDIRPKITVVGVGGAGGNAGNTMIRSKLEGVDFLVANTDAQALQQSLCERRIQLGSTVTKGLGAAGRPRKRCATSPSSAPVPTWCSSPPAWAAAPARAQARWWRRSHASRGSS